LPYLKFILNKLILFRRNDKGKTSFAFVLKTQAKAFGEVFLSASSKPALLIESAVCLKNILVINKLGQTSDQLELSGLGRVHRQTPKCLQIH
jgi:hypothetical protein